MLGRGSACGFARDSRGCRCAISAPCGRCAPPLRPPSGPPPGAAWSAAPSGEPALKCCAVRAVGAGAPSLPSPTRAMGSDSRRAARIRPSSSGPTRCALAPPLQEFPLCFPSRRHDACGGANGRCASRVAQSVQGTGREPRAYKNDAKLWAPAKTCLGRPQDQLSRGGRC